MTMLFPECYSYPLPSPGDEPFYTEDSNIFGPVSQAPSTVAIEWDVHSMLYGSPAQVVSSWDSNQSESFL
jgi:hypothetical protein